MGKTILISSHILPELAEMCDTLGVIDSGELIAHGSVQSIQEKLQSEKVISVKLTGDYIEAIRFFENDPLVSQITEIQDKGILQFLYKGTEHDQLDLLRKAMSAGLPILAFSEEETDLEDVFMEITKGAETL